MEQEWDEAFALTDPRCEPLPDNPHLLVWAGVLSERRGDTARAHHLSCTRPQALCDPDASGYPLALATRRPAISTGPWPPPTPP